MKKKPMKTNEQTIEEAYERLAQADPEKRGYIEAFAAHFWEQPREEREVILNRLRKLQSLRATNQ